MRRPTLDRPVPRDRSPRSVGARAGLVALALAGRARAQSGGGLALAWEAPDGCPDEAAVLRSVADVRGRALGPTDRPLRVDVRVRRDGARWRATLATRSGAATGERTLEAATCQRLAQAAATVIALAMDEARDAPEPPPAPPATTTPTQPPPAPSPVIAQRPPSPAVAPPVVAPPRARFTGAVEVRMLLDAASLPGVSAGVSVGARVRAGVVEGGVDLGALLPRDAEGPRAGTGVTASLLFVDVTGCLRGGRARWRLGGCLGLEAGGMAASSFGVVRPASEVSLTVYGVVRARFDFALTRAVWLTAGPELLIAALRPRYGIEGAGVVYEAPAAVVRGAVGVSWGGP